MAVTFWPASIPMEQGDFSMLKRVALVIVLVLVVPLLSCRAAAKSPVPPPNVNAALATSHSKDTAVFAGGCFWGTQAVFERVKGVLDTTAGYSGGAAATAHYQDVITETTGHTESVRVVYDPSEITYGQLLRVFFSVAHDPTELNRQGNDVGPSYRSVIFYANDEQKRIATAYIAQLDAAHVFSKPIVTQVVPLKAFYPAETYHQDYALKNPGNPYIYVCDRPKIAALRKEFPNLFQNYDGK